MLTAFRLCGEIDIDGNNQEYGAEVDGESDMGEGGLGEGRHHGEGEGGDSDDSERSINIRHNIFPVYRRRRRGS